MSAAPDRRDEMGRPDVVRTRRELADRLSPGEAGAHRVALVPTMGALHAGHLSLVTAAREAVGPAGLVVVSIFVNPTQFAAGEDLASYPRTPAEDLRACAEAGVDVVWTPEVTDVYPDPDPGIRVDPGPLGGELEGAVRPTHFSGVLTVVAKLVGAVRPDVVVLGEKDYQQLVLVRAMVSALDLSVEVVGVPTHREADGLARSSRNRYLDPAQRALAAVLPQALDAGVASAAGGHAAVLAAVADQLVALDGLDDDAAGVDYVALRTPDLREEARQGPARLLLAARVGTTRLIDNAALVLPPSSPRSQETPCFAP